MLYEVRAAAANSELTTLHLEAASVSDARAQALKLRLAPVSVKPYTASERGAQSRFDLALFAEELRILLMAGLPVLDAIDGLAERQGESSSKGILDAVARHVRQGEKLSQAMARQPQVFPPLFTGIVAAAESTSSLPESLAKFVGHQRHLKQLHDRMATAAIYPTILLVVGTGITLFLLVYVVPRFASVYRSGGRTLPWASQWLLGAGEWLGRHGLVLGLFGCALGAGAWVALRQRADAGGWLAVANAWPPARRRMAMVDTARLYRTLGMLIQGGIAVREAMALAASVTFGARRAALEGARQLVEGGLPLSDSLDRHGLASPLAMRLLKVGEQGGRLGDMLERAAEFHEHETALWIERFGRVFGPALMILISVVVALVVVLLYMPMFDLAGGLP